MSDERQPLRASVVVATRNRAGSLARLLEMLEAQTMPREAFEIVVVDDHSSDATRDVLDRSRAGSRGPLQTLLATDSHGPAAARNLGIRAARAPIVAFTDDDCAPDPAWLEAGLECVARGAHGVVMGATDPADVVAAKQPFARTMRADHEDGRYPTCNVFYSRRALDQAGGFDERFRFACGEDTDLAWRVKALGFTSAFCPKARVAHAVRAPDYPLYLRERRRFAEQILLVKRHPHLRRLFYRRYFYQRSHVHVLASALLVAGTAALGWKLALLLPVVWLDRFRRAELGTGASRRVRVAAQLAVGDLWEFAVFCYWSLRYRALLI
jgi:glycosyltransferase involved in cell wall biosynthesis